MAGIVKCYKYWLLGYIVACVCICVAMPLWASDAAPETTSEHKDVAKPASASSEQTVEAGSKKRLVCSTIQAIINVPPEFVWKVLTDFPNHPKVFHRIKTSTVVKHEGDLFYVKDVLKPSLLALNKEHQLTVTNLSGAPRHLSWQMLEGNFKSATGVWDLEPIEHGESCKVTYILEVDPGPLLPPSLVACAMHQVQKEVVASLTNICEKQYSEEHKQ